MIKKESYGERFREFLSVLKNEYKYIFNDAGVILIIFGAVILYSTLYSLAYNNEVLRDVPIAVVDNSMSPSSREFLRKVDASPNVNIALHVPSLAEAQKLFLERKVNGVVVIPKSFEKDILSNKKAFISVYADAGYFLMYKQVLLGIVDAMNDMNGCIEIKRFMLSGANQAQATALSEPVKTTMRTLFNPAAGYGTFVMPAILVMIIQQTLLIGIGMIGGTWREMGLYKKLIPKGRIHLSTLPIVTGKAFAYFSVYVVTLCYVFGFHYKLFGYPQNAHTWDLVRFMLPYLLSSIFLGITLSSLFRHRENSLITLLFTSIPFLMISGVSVPVEALPTWLVTVGKIIPSSSGIMGFINLQTMGSSLSDVHAQYSLLWILTGVYFLTACIGMNRLAEKLK